MEGTARERVGCPRPKVSLQREERTGGRGIREMGAEGRGTNRGRVEKEVWGKQRKVGAGGLGPWGIQKRGSNVERYFLKLRKKHFQSTGKTASLHLIR